MGIRKTHRAVLAGAAAAGLMAAGYGTAYGTAGDSPDRNRAGGGAQHTDRSAGASDRDYESTLTLGDGRKVNVRLVDGKGVQERHRGADSKQWSKWQTLYKSKSDPCQGVDLGEDNGTVTLIADFGLYCSDGEPPQESVAGVGTGNLTNWDIDMTKGFDGWESASIGDDGNKVAFIYNGDSGLYSLRWDRGEGFAEIDRPKK